jgi:hypothetical protein
VPQLQQDTDNAQETQNQANAAASFPASNDNATSQAAEHTHSTSVTALSGLQGTGVHTDATTTNIDTPNTVQGAPVTAAALPSAAEFALREEEELQSTHPSNIAFE